MTEKIAATVFITSKPGKAEELKNAILEMIDKTTQELGCEVFRIFQSAENPEIFVLWEIFVDDAAMREHMAKEYTKKYFALDLVESAIGTRHAELA